MGGSHVAASNGGKNVFPKNLADLARQISVWLVGEALKPFLHEYLEQHFFFGRLLLPQAVHIEFTDSLNRGRRGIKIAIDPHALPRNENPHRAVHAEHISLELFFRLLQKSAA